MPFDPATATPVDSKKKFDPSTAAPPEITRRRALDIMAPGRMDTERALLRSEEGRERLKEAEGQGILAPRSMPGLLADIALESGSGIGQAIGAHPALSIPTRGASIPIGGALFGGAGNYAAQQRRILAGEQDEFKLGQMLSSAGTGAIPGAPLTRGTTLGTMVLEGAKQGAGGVAGRTVETVIDEGRVPTGTEVLVTGAIPAIAGGAAQKIQGANPEIRAAVSAAEKGPGAQKRKTLEEAQKLGAIIAPSDVNPSWFNKRVESLAGPADVRRGAEFKNQELANRVAAEELRLPKDTEVTMPVIRSVRQEAAKPYGEIADISDRARAQINQITSTIADPHAQAIELAKIPDVVTQAKADIPGLAQARAAMNDNRPPYPQADPARLEIYKNARKQADELEAAIEDAAVAAGRPELLNELRDSRQLIAKSYDIERALNPGDASISVPTLGGMIDKSRPLSGGLETLGNFALAFPRAVKEGAKIQPFGLSKTEAITGGLLAGSGMAATGGDPKALLLAAVPPLLSSAARRTALSRPYQYFFADIPPPVVKASPDAKALATRVVAQEGAQELADEVEPKKKSKE